MTTDFLTGYSPGIVDLLKALGIDDAQSVLRVIVDIPAGGYVTVHVQRVSDFKPLDVADVLASSPLKPKVYT